MGASLGGKCRNGCEKRFTSPSFLTTLTAPTLFASNFLPTAPTRELVLGDRLQILDGSALLRPSAMSPISIDTNLEMNDRAFIKSQKRKGERIDSFFEFPSKIENILGKQNKYNGSIKLNLNYITTTIYFFSTQSIGIRNVVQRVGKEDPSVCGRGPAPSGSITAGRIHVESDDGPGACGQFDHEGLPAVPLGDDLGLGVGESIAVGALLTSCKE